VTRSVVRRRAPVVFASVTLRRRFSFVFALYFAIVLVGSALVIRQDQLRDEQIEREEQLLADGLDRGEEAEFADAQDRIRDLRNQLNAIIAATLAAALVTTVWAAFSLRRWVTRPLDRIGGAVRTVRGGARHTTVPITGPPEIARLAGDVENLRRLLNREILDAVRAREAVEERAKVLVSLQSQLEPEFEELPNEWTVAGQVEAAEGVVAGDCYDVVRVSASQLALVVVDISGHGAVPGILALRCRELLRAALRNDFDPGACVQWARQQLDDLGDETFLSAFVAVADLATGGLRYANAGHPPALLCGKSEAVELMPTGPIVGPIDGSWRTGHTQLATGDTLAIYTDGLIDVRNDQREEYGLDRLVDLVCGASCDDADAIVKRTLDDVTEFAPGRLRDDATILLLCRGPREDRPAVRRRA
jgi:serine phosphatase RsbU (regulator of sigma subunit)